MTYVSYERKLDEIFKVHNEVMRGKRREVREEMGWMMELFERIIERMPYKYRPGRLVQWWRLGWRNPMKWLEELICLEREENQDIFWLAGQLVAIIEKLDVLAQMLDEAEHKAGVAQTFQQWLAVMLWDQPDLLEPGVSTVDKWFAVCKGRK